MRSKLRNVLEARDPLEDVLIFFPTYNESGNVRRLIEEIHAELSGAAVLVIDDASIDGTGELLESLQSGDPLLHIVHRPRKLGVGTAHKLALLYAREAGYQRFITMDADFSHHPRYLRRMLTQLETAEFVTGSRYVNGGRCDYGLRRQMISRTANAIARMVLGLGLAENTTLYRGFTRPLLFRMEIDRIRSDGYSFAVESLSEVSRVTKSLAEFPIHFEDRVAGDSKISKAEIFKAILTLLRLGFDRLNPFDHAKGSPSILRISESVSCVGCGSHHQIEKFPARIPGIETSGSNRWWRSKPTRDSAAYSCASHDSRNHGRILQCLQCALVFMEPTVLKRELIAAYTNSQDESYLHNMEARVQTFDYNFSRVRGYVPKNARVLDVGSHCGVFLRVAEGYGMDIMGVEPSAWAVEVSRRVTTRSIVHGTLDALPANTEPFDVVTMWDVLEHFFDPEAELHRVNSLLQSNGTLMLSTIMIDNWFPRVMGRKWPWLMEMHLFYFSEGTITDMLQRSGFEILETRNYCHIVTVEYLFEKVASLGVPGMKLASRLVGRTPVGKMLIPFRFGDIKLFVCRKIGHTCDELDDSRFGAQ